MADIIDRNPTGYAGPDGRMAAYACTVAGLMAPDAACHIVTRCIGIAEYAGMQAEFDRLASRADAPNPFMSPALAVAAAAGLPAHSVVVLAAFDRTDPHRLLGIWCLRRQRDLWSAGLAVLQTPILPRYECLAAPVLDRQHGAAVMSAMLSHVRASPDLPKVIRATGWPVALDQLLPAGWRASPSATWQRPAMLPVTGMDAETYLKRAMGKALNKRNSRQTQLGKLGTLVIGCRRGSAAVEAFEHYVALEAKGWKGQSGTSLAEVPADAAYMRAAIRKLAEADRVCVDVIKLDGNTVAAGVVVEASGNNLFWKAAFDEDLARFAPGSLLHLAVTRRLFAEGRARLDSGIMEFTNAAHLPWAEHADMARVTIADGPAGVAVRLGGHLRHKLRRWKHG